MASTQIYTERIVKRDGKSLQILGIAIDSISKEGVLKQVQNAIEKNRKIFITTPNPEIVLQASNDIVLKKILNSSDIAIADGYGLILAGKYLNKNIPLYLVKGRELFLDLIKLANDNSWKVVLLGNRKGSAEEAAKSLREKFKRVQIHGIVGPDLTLDAKTETEGDVEIEKKVIKEIGEIRPQMLFIGFGAPRQEKWIYKWKSELNANVLMVVGGTFDYVSGKVPTSPAFWPKSLEWLWRLLTKPGHWKRVWNAVIVFPYQVLVERLKNSKTPRFQNSKQIKN